MADPPKFGAFAVKVSENELGRVYRIGSQSITVYPGEKQSIAFPLTEGLARVEVEVTSLMGEHVETIIIDVEKK
ncbi:MAG TPA: hypothetical protein VJL39_00895 [Candidatus Paceibacterota bacterium]